MDKLISNQISAYLKTQSRNKIVFYRDGIIDITAIDLGRLLSQAIYNLKDESKLPMRVSNELDKILNASFTDHSSYGRMLAISNIGIVLEHDLKQDFNMLLAKYSNNNVLFVQWDGEIENDNLYFLSKGKGIKINIKNLSHIII
jgi:hypothetical protein